MAVMYISEYKDIAGDASGNLIQAVMEDGNAIRQAVTFTGTSAQSAPFSNGTKLIEIRLDTAGYLEFGSNPTAITAGSANTTKPLGANESIYVCVVPGQRVAAIT